MKSKIYKVTNLSFLGIKTFQNQKDIKKKVKVKEIGKHKRKPLKSLKSMDEKISQLHYAFTSYL